MSWKVGQSVCSLISLTEGRRLRKKFGHVMVDGKKTIAILTLNKDFHFEYIISL